MVRTRRDLLRAGAALAASAVAGCASFGGSNVTYPSTTTGAGASGTTATTTTATTATTTRTTEATTTEQPTTEPTTAESTTTEQPTTTVPTANPTLAAETATVVDEIVWFATAYPSAIEAYRAAVGRVRAVVGQLRSASDVDDNDLRRLDSVLEQLAEIVRSRLQPHFPGVDGRLTDPDNTYVETVRRFARRGDWDRTKTELERMYTFYVAVGLQRFVDDAFPNDPVQGTLLSSLTADAAAGPVLFELGYHDAGYGAFAYAGEDRHLVDDPFDARERLRLGNLFGAVEVDAGRRLQLYANPAVLPQSFSYKRSDELRSVPVHVQRYRDARTAADAVVGILDGPVVQEGTERLGPTEWRRCYYYHDGDIVYAYVVRAGEFVITTGPSRTAWEERSENWTEPLERSWLWNG